MPTRSSHRQAAVIGILAVVAVCGAWAQEVAPPVQPAGAPAPAAALVPKVESETLKLWKDLQHYIKIGRADAARSFGQAILKAKVEPREVYFASMDVPGSQAVLAQSVAMDGMKPIVEQIQQLIEKGYQAHRADPEEISKSIDMLARGVRAYELGVQRLKASGEYALPQMIQRLTDPTVRTEMKELIITVLPKLGKDAVRGLSTALLSDEPLVLEAAAKALGHIQYGHAVPRLKELAERKGTLDRVREAAQRALSDCGSKADLDKGVAELFYDLALKYYYRAESVRGDERYDTANFWYWKPGLGLIFTPVPREIFCDLYAMRMAHLALQHDPNFHPAVSLWLAAFVKKELNLPPGKTDATVAAGEHGAEYYLRAGGGNFLQEIIARAAKDHETGLLKVVVRVLAEVSSSDGLAKPKIAGGATPLVELLSYPDREVRTMAAEALAAALPTEPFRGSHIVVPILNDALRQTGRKTALVVVAEEKLRNQLKDAVRAAGFDIIDNPEPAGAVTDARKAGGADIAILATQPDPGRVLGLMRQQGLFSAVPAIISSKRLSARRLAETDGRAIVIDTTFTPEEVAKAIDDALKLGAGMPLTPEQAAAWTIRVAGTIRLLGLTSNPVLPYADTQDPLIQALSSPNPEVGRASAAALAAMDTPEAQRAIVDLALKAGLTEEMRLAAFALATESVRRFGRKLTDEQANAVRGIVVSREAEPIRMAAARLLGSLNLPARNIKDLMAAARSKG